MHLCTATLGAIQKPMKIEEQKEKMSYEFLDASKEWGSAHSGMQSEVTHNYRAEISQKNCTLWSGCWLSKALKEFTECWKTKKDAEKVYMCPVQINWLLKTFEVKHTKIWSCKLLVTLPKFIVSCFPVLEASAVHSKAHTAFPLVSYIDEWF